MYQISNAKSTEMAKIEVAKTQSQFVLKQFYVFPEHYAFCLCDFLTRCHRYIQFITPIIL